MHFKSVVKEAEHVGNKLGSGSSHARLHSDEGDETLFEVFREDIVERSCYHQSVLIPRVAELFPPPPLVLIGPSSESPPSLTAVTRGRGLA